MMLKCLNLPATMIMTCSFYVRLYMNRPTWSDISDMSGRPFQQMWQCPLERWWMLGSKSPFLNLFSPIPFFFLRKMTEDPPKNCHKWESMSCFHQHGVEIKPELSCVGPPQIQTTGPDSIHVCTHFKHYNFTKMTVIGPRPGPIILGSGIELGQPNQCRLLVWIHHLIWTIWDGIKWADVTCMDWLLGPNDWVSLDLFCRPKFISGAIHYTKEDSWDTEYGGVGYTDAHRVISCSSLQALGPSLVLFSCFHSRVGIWYGNSCCDPGVQTWRQDLGRSQHSQGPWDLHPLPGMPSGLFLHISFQPQLINVNVWHIGWPI